MVDPQSGKTKKIVVKTGPKVPAVTSLVGKLRKAEQTIG